MDNVIEKLKGGLIVSCQALDDEPLHSSFIMSRMAKAAEEGTSIPMTFKDYLDKWVYSVKDHGELLDKIGGKRLMSLKNAPHLGYSVTHLK